MRGTVVATDMNFWGITGTNGKTTTTWILAEFLNAAQNRKCGYITTVEVFDGVKRFYTGYTTPPLKQLLEIYAAMEANGCTDCVMEVSSHAIHQNRTGDTIFAGGAFTNLSEDHLDYHKTMEEYFRVKFSFAERIAASRSSSPSDGRKDFSPFVVCMDGGYAEEMLEKCGTLPLNVIPVSFKHPRFDLKELRLVGDYNKSNVLVAASLAEMAGVDHETIQSAISTLVPRWGRLEKVDTKASADVYVDFAHTPDGLEKVLKAARGFTKGKVVCVFGAGGDRDAMKRPLMGEAAAKFADKIIVTSDNPRSEDPEEIIKAILPPLYAANASFEVEVDRAAAIYMALDNAEVGDTVLICGKGHETTQEIKGVKYPFDDREIARGYLPVRMEKSWKRMLAGEFTREYFKDLTVFVREEYKKGPVYPPASLIFNAFEKTPFDNVKVVIIGQDPYHEVGQAQGLAFYVPENIKTPPSLLNIAKELKNDLGGSGKIPDLVRWAEGGVLLLNATLTVRAGSAGSHQGRGWEVFTDAAIKALNEKKESLVFILWGSYAQRKGAFIDRSRHYVIESPHPSPLSAHRGFFGSKPFSKANSYLCSKGLAPIDWGAGN